MAHHNWFTWLIGVGNVLLIGMIAIIFVISSTEQVLSSTITKPTLGQRLPLPTSTPGNRVFTPVESIPNPNANTPTSTQILVELSLTPAGEVFAQTLQQTTSPIRANIATRRQLNQIQRQQELFLAQLSQQGIAADLVTRTQYVFNSIALRVSVADVSTIQNLPGVVSVTFDTELRPDSRQPSRPVETPEEAYE